MKKCLCSPSGARSLGYALRWELRSFARDFAQQGAWMARAYAIGLSAGTPALILTIPELLSSPADVTTGGVLMGTAWVINLAVAEHFIRRPGLSRHLSRRAR